MTRCRMEQFRRLIRRPVVSKLLAWTALLAIPAVLPAQSVSFTNFTIPSSSSQPRLIVTGPDGALWFTENGTNKIGRITTAGVITEFTIPTSSSAPLGIDLGPDGALWFTETNGNKIGRITASGAITEFPVPTASSFPYAIAAGPDGALWFTEGVGNKIARITTAGVITEFPIPTANATAEGIASGPDGALWFVETGANKIGRVSLAGAITEFPIPTTNSQPLFIAKGTDGALWFTELTSSKIGRITVAGVITEFSIPASGFVQAITSGPDGNLWFTDSEKIGQVTTSGVITMFPVTGLASTAQGVGIATGPDGALWFAETTGGKIWRAALSTQSAPVLQVTSAHAGNFVQGQPIAFYTLTVKNTGGAATSGSVSVTDTLPTGMTATAIRGPDWGCSLSTLTCARPDILPAGGSFPPITVTVSVASGVPSPLINQVSASTAGSATATASDPTNIITAFTDITGNDVVFIPAIDLLQESGITTGCQSNPPAYCSSVSIPESQMAVFVIRSVIGNDNFAYTPSQYFTDVPPSYLYYPWIQKEQDLGIAQPCAPTMFCPETPVTRAIMAALIIRSRFGTALPTNYPTTPYFTDVPANHPFFPYIQKMRQLGITSGCSPTTYCPDDPVTRGQMAVFIMRGEFNQILQDPSLPILVWVSPATASAGQTITVTLAGQNTNFSTASTVIAGPGITAGSVNVIDASTLTVQLTIAAGATTGPRSITVMTGTEEATLPNGFKVQ